MGSKETVLHRRDEPLASQGDAVAATTQPDPTRLDEMVRQWSGPHLPQGSTAGEDLSALGRGKLGAFRLSRR